MRVRRKPAEVDAVQWFPDPPPDFPHIDRHGVHYSQSSGVTCFPTVAGPMRISPGDWIVTSPDGRRWVCEAACFAALYEEVS